MKLYFLISIFFEKDASVFPLSCLPFVSIKARFGDKRGSARLGEQRVCWQQSVTAIQLN